MEDTTTKKILITGSAANGLTPEGFEEAAEGGSHSRKGVKSRSQKKFKVTATRDGGGTSPGTLIQLASTSAPGAAVAASGLPSDLTLAGAAIGKIAPSIVGGTAEPKIVLSKTKKKSKIRLTAPKPVVKAAEVHPRRKTMKKVNMSLKGLTRKMKKASKIRRSATEKSIGDIKKELISMDLVKADTKAPDNVLRQIYSDVEMMKKRAL